MSPTSELLLERKALRVIFKCNSDKANAPFRVREPPAGPKKLSYISPEGTFPKNLSEAANFDQILLFLEDWSGHSR